jgi:hypothetical protein
LLSGPKAQAVFAIVHVTDILAARAIIPVMDLLVLVMVHATATHPVRAIVHVMAIVVHVMVHVTDILVVHVI